MKKLILMLAVALFLAIVPVAESRNLGWAQYEAHFIICPERVETSIQSVAVETHGSVFVVFSFTFANGHSENNGVFYTLYRDDIEIFRMNGWVQPGMDGYEHVSRTLVDDPPPGRHLYSLEIYPLNGWGSAQWRSLGIIPIH